MKIKLLFAAFILLLITSCQEQPQLVKVKGRYTLELPTFLNEATDLHSDASLQYKNGLKEFYVIVLDEDKNSVNKTFEDSDLGYTSDLKGYADLLLANMAENSSFTAPPKLKDTSINKLRARVTSTSGIVDNIPVYWKIAYIEGKNRYYQLMVWTLTENQEEHEAQMEKIVQSFKETDKSKKRK